MAGMPRGRANVDYRNLHLLSSAVLYNTARKPSGKLLKVDRIVDKRRVGHVSNVRADGTKVFRHLI